MRWSLVFNFMLISDMSNNAQKSNLLCYILLCISILLPISAYVYIEVSSTGDFSGFSAMGKAVYILLFLIIPLNLAGFLIALGKYLSSKSKMALTCCILHAIFFIGWFAYLVCLTNF